MTATDECRTAPVEVKPVEDVWYEDGNLILQAENSLFRIYSGMLAARSSVFQDMLSFPPPPEGNAVMDGCPIVQVYDSADDMTYFLKAIMDSSFFEPAPSPTELPIVAGVLRLSLKYDVKYLRRRALDHLLTTFPTSLPAWKGRDAKRTIPPVDNTPFAALCVAREFDLPWLVPAIMYCISSHPIEKSLDGVQWQDVHLELSWQDKRTCVVGRAALLMIQNRGALELTKTAAHASPEEGGSHGCTGEGCASTRQRCAEIMSSWSVAGFLDFYEENTSSFSGGLCPSCLETFERGCKAASQGMWNTLPNIFGLPAWEDLEKLRVAALD